MTADVVGSVRRAQALRDGSQVELRPIEASDGPALIGLHGRMSLRSRYQRFFNAHTRLQQDEVEHWTHVAGARRCGLVAVSGDEIVGWACYEPVSAPKRAEVAFYIDDAHQGLGLGTALLYALVPVALREGIEYFTASVLRDNSDMLAVFRDAGFEYREWFEGPVIRLELDLEAPPLAPAALPAAPI